MSDAIYASLAGDNGYFDSQVVFVAESGPKANRKKQLAIMDQDGANVQVLSSGNALDADAARLSRDNSDGDLHRLRGRQSAGLCRQSGRQVARS